MQIFNMIYFIIEKAQFNRKFLFRAVAGVNTPFVPTDTKMGTLARITRRPGAYDYQLYFQKEVNWNINHCKINRNFIDFMDNQ